MANPLHGATPTLATTTGWADPHCLDTVRHSPREVPAPGSAQSETSSASETIFILAGFRSRDLGDPTVDSVTPAPIIGPIGVDGEIIDASWIGAPSFSVSGADPSQIFCTIFLYFGAFVFPGVGNDGRVIASFTLDAVTNPLPLGLSALNYSSDGGGAGMWLGLEFTNNDVIDATITFDYSIFALFTFVQNTIDSTSFYCSTEGTFDPPTVSNFDPGPTSTYEP